jgi:rsbT antagonist protein RsbS
MAIPILKQGSVLIVSIQGIVTDKDLIQLRDDISDQVGQFRASGVVLDVSALDVLDSFATRILRGMADITRLRGAKTVIVGIQPEVAFAMVQLGLNLDGVTTGLDLEEGLAKVAGDGRRRGQDVR